MILPDGFMGTWAQLNRGGIMLGLAPSSEATFDTEVWARTSSGTARLWQTLNGQSAHGQSLILTDAEPVDGRFRWYKARTVGAGYWPSAFTPEVKARPAWLPNSQSILPLSAAGVGAPILLRATDHVSTGLPAITYGTALAPASVAKQQTVSALDFIANNAAAALVTFDNFGRATNVQADSVAYVRQARVFIPSGCTIVGLNSGLFRSNAGASAVAVLYRIDLGPARTALVTNTATGTGGWQAPGGTCSQLVPLGAWYLIEVTMNNGGTGSRSGYADQVVLYTTPTDQATF